MYEHNGSGRLRNEDSHRYGTPRSCPLVQELYLGDGERGHKIKVTARDKDVTRQLLDAYHIPYEIVGKLLPGKISLPLEWVDRTYKITKIGKNFNADIYIGVLNPAITFSAWVNRKQSLTLNDTEHMKFAKKITYPFTDYILTPSSYGENIGRQQIRYNGYHELAYLHPNYFTPNPAVLEELDLKVDNPFIILRFVSWGRVMISVNTASVIRLNL